jgi:heme exporter protein B
VFAFLFLQAGGYAPGAFWRVPVIVFFGSVGIAGVGTLLATMSVNTKGKDFVLPVLMIPLMFPLLLAAVSATSAAILGGDGAAQQYLQGLGMVAAYDAVMLLAAYALYEFVVGA